MGFSEWLKPSGRYPTGKNKGGGYVSGKQARNFAKGGGYKHCKKSGCHDDAGGHRFKQKGADDYCAKHAHPDNR
jgi:hypothetical protein